jgi:prepilin-type N-terminal cleavage/methylation domain-containing protein
MKKKGFTLIELLAVIVILAVIAIIVTPMIASTVNSAKSSSLKASASGIIDAAEQYCSRKMVSDSTFTAHSYQINESVANEIGFTYNAEISGTLAIYSDCSVALAITDGTSQATKDKASESVATATKETNFEDTAKALVILTPESCFTTADSGLGDGTIKITDYTCTDPDIIIPGTIGGKTVVAIGDSAFEEKYFSYISDNSNIKKLNSNYNSSGVMRKPYYSDVIVQPSEISKHDPRSIYY